MAENVRAGYSAERLGEVRKALDTGYGIGRRARISNNLSHSACSHLSGEYGELPEVKAYAALKSALRILPYERGFVVDAFERYMAHTIGPNPDAAAQILVWGNLFKREEKAGRRVDEVLRKYFSRCDDIPGAVRTFGMALDRELEMKRNDETSPRIVVRIPGYDAPGHDAEED